MTPRFQADADLHFDIVAGVLRREPAIDFQSAQEVYAEGLADLDVLVLAAAENRILVSHDVSTMPRCFQTFMEQRGNSPGLLLLPQTLPIGQAIEDLVLIWTASDASEWRNQICWLPL